ncbi:hypothetical protein BCR44DRAFT_1427316 [Catenaria anguillulae PL171]|uniref:Dihydrolipoamide acetyltransferase component of pyruvate dehydrogenase complex n=1 Tax=Catenaria anguillulae PL171 TaxID=765915 RepID=A0A1Y2I179_9FUNG|nr:hypothetical protein BCR44DRAFT_1427316 [Catenaria anguillulae PL171]
MLSALSRRAARPAARLATAAIARSAAVSAPQVAAAAVAPRTLAVSAARIAAPCFSAMSARGYADHVVVKVPQMADSISEGTLKTWHKKVGDFVRADEEVATIETDKIDVAVNSPTSGVIVEHFANEEDTVVVAADLFKLEKKDASEAPAPAPAAAAAPAPTPTPALLLLLHLREKMSRMRLRIAERLKESQNTAASLTTFNEIDMSNLIEFRAKYKDQILKEHGIKFGFMSAFIKAAAYGIKHVPVINARIEGNETVYPNLSMCRDNKLSIEDMAGGTFTISNGGVFGSMFGTPIINMPQSAILGMHAVKERAVVVNGKIEVRPVMYVCLTYDHRLIDGREATTFLMKVKEAIEDPRRMLL